jgi:hypothetical protein
MVKFRPIWSHWLEIILLAFFRWSLVAISLTGICSAEIFLAVIYFEGILSFL